VFDVRGAQRIRRDEHGDLVLKMSEGEIRWHKPVVYQEKDGTRQEIAARYAIPDTNRVTFEVAKYDASRPLYIDPLIYSTYLGGSGSDTAVAIAVDSQGAAYVTGTTYSTDFPGANPLKTTYAGNGDAFVAKINPAGSALVYSTYLGGGNIDQGEAIAVDGNGDAYVTGFTNSANFPTSNALQTSFGGEWDAFVTELNPSGTALIYSTYLGGSNSDWGFGIRADGSGNAYVTGLTGSTDFPTKNPLQASNAGSSVNAFVTKISTNGAGLVYSTYLGGSFSDVGYAIALDSADNAYVTGSAQSTDFPLKNPLQATQGSAGNYTNAFVTEINSAGSSLVYSTYLGGDHGDVGYGIAVDGSANAYVTGITSSSNFPLTPGAFQTSAACCPSAFVSKLGSDGSTLVYSTYLGGSPGTSGSSRGSGIAVDGQGHAYVVGSAFSSTFPVTPGAFQTRPGGSGDAYVTVFSPSGSALTYSTYLGGSLEDDGYGIAVDGAGNGYFTGQTQSTNFPTASALQPNSAGAGDAFVAKLEPNSSLLATTTTLSSSLNPSTYGKSVTFTATVSSQTGGPPTGIVTFRDGSTILNEDFLSNGQASFSVSTLPLGSNSITASYAGGSDFAASTSAPLNEVVLAATTTTLSSSLNPSSYGQTVTFTATVTSSLGPPPNGETVTFRQGSTVLGTGTLSGGSASFSTSTIPAGTKSITVTYPGDAKLASSTSKPLNQVVNRATTSTTLVSSTNPSSFNQSVTFTATVTPQFSGTPTGTVTFKNGTTTMATATLHGGVAKFTTTKLAVGTASITAVYYGEASFVTSTSSALSQVVSPANTTTTLASSPNPSTVGQSVTFTATVTGQFAGVVTGTVTFMDGTSTLGTVTVSSHVARLHTSALAVGTHNITATYNGSTDFTSSSASLTQTVN
jgi:hypothetical protein